MVIAKSKEPKSKESKSKESPLVIKFKRSKFDEMILKLKNINLTDEIPLKPGLFKNDNDTFTLVRENGTSRVVNLYQIRKAVGNNNTFRDFLRIHFKKKDNGIN